MSEQKTDLDDHRKWAVDLFNGVWGLLDKADRTAEESRRMIHMAHASIYHWSFVGNAENLYIGEWQVSRVYAVLKLGESALYHARAALELCLDNGFTGFNLAYAHEAMARAFLVLGEPDEQTRHKELAASQAATVDDPEMRKMIDDDLATL